MCAWNPLLLLFGCTDAPVAQAKSQFPMPVSTITVFVIALLFLFAGYAICTKDTDFYECTWVTRGPRIFLAHLFTLQPNERIM